MYRHCIFCASELGGNEAIETFPVGSRLAFDAQRGRLWALCPRCTRWNLAPIEERWEAIEEAERLFRDARLRVHSENVGLARVADGTRLIRVGEALPRELAAWRYGDQLVRRRRRAVAWGGAAAAAAAVGAFGAVALAGAPFVPLVLNAGQIVSAVHVFRTQQKVLHRVPAGLAPGGREIRIRALDLQLARVVEEDDALALELPGTAPMERREEGGVVRWTPPEPVRLRGSDAEALLAKAMARANGRGARASQLDRALDRLAEAGSREAFFRHVAAQRAGLFPGAVLAGGQARLPDLRGGFRRFVGTFRGERIGAGTVPLPPARSLSVEDALALEMALHEESERRAMEGELALLEAAWREAEEIAAIADVLPHDPLDALRAGDGERAAAAEPGRGER